jgi:hypothetical protein
MFTAFEGIMHTVFLLRTFVGQGLAVWTENPYFTRLARRFYSFIQQRFFGS